LLFFKKKLLLYTLKIIIFNITKGWRAKFKASAGHIFPAGRMLCMPGMESKNLAELLVVDNQIPQQNFKVLLKFGALVLLGNLIALSHLHIAPISSTFYDQLLRQ